MAENLQVDQWLADFEHPLKPAIATLRTLILKSDPRIEECIKWKSPTFVYRGNIASINPRTKKKISLMFHEGAKIPGKHPELVGGGGTVKYMYFADADEVDAKANDVRKAMRAWCAWQDDLG